MKPKRSTTFEDKPLDSRRDLAKLLNEGRIYDMAGAAKVTGYCVRHLRRLCRAEKIAHHRLLGRYYLTPADIAALFETVKAKP